MTTPLDDNDDEQRADNHREDGGGVVAFFRNRTRWRRAAPKNAVIVAFFRNRKRWLRAREFEPNGGRDWGAFGVRRAARIGSADCGRKTKSGQTAPDEPCLTCRERRYCGCECVEQSFFLFPAAASSRFPVVPRSARRRETVLHLLRTNRWGVVLRLNGSASVCALTVELGEEHFRPVSCRSDRTDDQQRT